MDFEWIQSYKREQSMPKSIFMIFFVYYYYYYNDQYLQIATGFLAAPGSAPWTAWHTGVQKLHRLKSVEAAQKCAMSKCISVSN